MNHFMHRAHCSSTSPSCRPLSSSGDPVRASAASEPSAPVSCQKANVWRINKMHVNAYKLAESVQKTPQAYTGDTKLILCIRSVDSTTPSLPFDDSVSMLAGASRNVASLKSTKKRLWSMILILQQGEFAPGRNTLYSSGEMYLDVLPKQFVQVPTENNACFNLVTSYSDFFQLPHKINLHSLVFDLFYVRKKIKSQIKT